MNELMSQRMNGIIRFADSPIHQFIYGFLAPDHFHGKPRDGIGKAA
jgi:hypothetical protein